VTTPAPVRVAVVGATGYAGAELVRLLARHPNVRITGATSEKDAGKPLAAVHRSLAFTQLQLEHVDVERLAANADAAFVALPHGASTPVVEGLLERGLRVVDIGADFRFDDRAAYEAAYGTHHAPHLIGEAVYGLPEFTRGEVESARLVANPGCYPTGALLGLLPIVDAVVGTVFVDSKSGTSGAGRGAATNQLFAEVTESIRPYSVWRHRHQPEMENGLRRLGGRRAPIRFTPHLLPIARGLMTSCYVALEAGVDVARRLAERYRDEPFVSVLEAGEFPETRNVRGTNAVEIACVQEDDGRHAVVLTAIDNLGKGAAGQAVQNFNRMWRFDERTALDLAPALP